jgi:hypothetical protein
MLQQLKSLVHRPRRTLVAALATLIASIAGCDKKVNWRGVGTDSEDRGPVIPTNATPGKSAHDQHR